MQREGSLLARSLLLLTPVCVYLGVSFFIHPGDVCRKVLTVGGHRSRTTTRMSSRASSGSRGWWPTQPTTSWASQLGQ